uniref:NADH dehydrogenase subunit 6 n=1 Tax=Laemonema goodebeanorum TaxID=630676 RepID=UPI0028FCD983|nr:NADH dehydrogenase subunit 6 [Laemonema goodebeanorum]WNH37754.1 NADH dehydrogenase subunit 6 [Laemonema goodebeanorum]
MTYIMLVVLVGIILSVISVASNPSPYYAVLGVVLVSGLGCGILMGHGGSFLSLVLFLIYLGGMLVVFAYSVALAAEPYPEAWGGWSVLGYIVGYFLLVVGGMLLFWGGWYEETWVSVNDLTDYSVVGADSGGIAFMYSLGGEMLLIGAAVLLLTLFLVLELTRGMARGALRSI